jgi:hypothetical protein
MIFRPRLMGNHDYLAAPEIIADICMSYEEMHSKPLLERFLESTSPCIVKFQSREPRPDALGAALLYVHRVSRGEELLTQCNTCYAGAGVALSPTSIVRVEWPSYVVGA